MEGQRWAIDTDAEPVPRFAGISIDIHLNWDLELTFDDGEQYTWSTVASFLGS